MLVVFWHMDAFISPFDATICFLQFLTKNIAVERIMQKSFLFLASTHNHRRHRIQRILFSKRNKLYVRYSRCTF